MEARCMKCKEQRTMANEKRVVFKNGANAMQGTCSKCGTKMSKMVPKQ